MRRNDAAADYEYEYECRNNIVRMEKKDLVQSKFGVCAYDTEGGEKLLVHKDFVWLYDSCDSDYHSGLSSPVGRLYYLVIVSMHLDRCIARLRLLCKYITILVSHSLYQSVN